ncbi:YifB family Mg chelatase-like AAA ATPase [Sphaerisporangium flaviroseum]|uniref:YifB family Mg chelatase-like AAA ATPase n=1 Tax=Sphaerisporangium flaviroseum TaxID=509199 RepID=A0ABP7J2K5_9ACTN
MTRASIRSASVIGADGHLLTVEADIGAGLAATHLLGLPTSAGAETRDRVRAAVINSGFTWPDLRITVSVFPQNLPSKGPAVDLAVAVTILAASGQIPVTALAGALAIGELGLDGRLRYVRGALPMVAAAADSGLKVAIVPPANAAETDLVPGITVASVRSLSELVTWLTTGELPVVCDQDPPGGSDGCADATLQEPDTDLADLPASYGEARYALEVCAAGGHHLMVYGQPGSPAHMLAERLPGLLPPLETQAVYEVAAIYSIAGRPAPARPPVAAPAPTTTPTGMLGSAWRGGRPGAASLAHRGVLLLPDAADFPVQVLNGLPQPMMSGQVSLTSSSMTVQLPARFQLAGTTRLCPCGSAEQAQSCTCTPATKRRYQARLSRLLEAVEVRAHVEPVPAGRVPGRAAGESTAVVAHRVRAARQRASARLAHLPWVTNAEVPAVELRTTFRADDQALKVLAAAADTGVLTAPMLPQVLRVAWTVADLRGARRPGRAEAQTALGLLTGRPS